MSIFVPNRPAIDPMQKFLESLENFDALRDSDTINRGTLNRIEPEIADDWPSRLHPRVRSALTCSGIERPYLHQAQAIDLSLNGVDVVMESPTASGKTLAFAAPMLHSLMQNRNSTSLMIYPMKALAFDQREQIRNVCKPLNIDPCPYDGDTGQEARDYIRQTPPQVLLTNPEYLNMSFLGSRDAWNKHTDGAKFLRNLRFVILDEMHEYRGFFGSNIALLLRRFFRYLNQIGTHPQIFLSTATCANPKEHARNLTGRDLELVQARNVLRPRRHFVFVDPDVRDFRYQDILRLRIENAAMASLEQGLQVLVFCPTKRFLEAAFKNCRQRAEENGFSAGSVAAFHADLKPETRQLIQANIKAGEVKVVFTTNALEIGLDVGGLDGIIMAGFPSSIMSAWQQIGRAGRGWDKDAFVLFYAMNDPIDRFFVGNLDAFLTKPFDELVVDPANEELIKKHLPSLIEEAGGSVKPHERELLGPAFFETAYKFPGSVPNGYNPQAYLNLRGGSGESFALKRNDQEIGQVSEMRRFREAFIGAVFPFYGQRYRVHSHEERAVVLEDCEQFLRTEPAFYPVLSTSDIYGGVGYENVNVFRGKLNITVNFTGYKLVDERSDSVIGTGDTRNALYLNDLHAFWIDFADMEDTELGIVALEHMIRVGSMFVIPSDRFDTSTYSKTGNEPTTYYYENYPGGIGISSKLFEVWDVAMEKGIEIARNCRCSLGCQNCIEPAKSWGMSSADINKVKGIELAQRLLEDVAHSPMTKFSGGLMMPI